MTLIKYMLSLFMHHMSRSIFLLVKYPNSSHIYSSVGIKDGLRFNCSPSTDFKFKTLNKIQVLWLKVVSRGSNHTLGSF